MYQKHLPISVKESFQCYLKQSDKTIYRFITMPTFVKIVPERTLSLKQLCTVFNPLPHTDPKTWTFLKLQAIGSTAKGAKYRLCSPPETGKNACDTIIHDITNDCTRVSKPTIAKLETLFYYNQKILMDEMTSLTNAQIREVEPFILSIADESPSFEKHSMAQKKDMNEVDIAATSAIFTYNDRLSLQEGSKHFDEIWQNIRAFNSRYPALYIEGKVLSDLPKLSVNEAKEICDKNFEKLRCIAKNLVYYFENMHKELHGWDRSELTLKGRKRVNFEAVIDAMDVYSDSQNEFNGWLRWVNKAVKDYKEKANTESESLTITEEKV
jgi:hypothetical protein